MTEEGIEPGSPNETQKEYVVRTNHIHIVVVELDILGNDGLDNGVDDCDQHNEEHNEMHVTGTDVFFLKSNCIGIVFLTFGFLNYVLIVHFNSQGPYW